MIRSLRERLDTLGGGRSLYPLAVLFGLNAVDELDQAAFSVLLPNIRDEFGLDLGSLTGLLAILVPITILLGLPIAYLADRGRRTRLAAGGGAVWGGFSILTGLAGNLPLLGLGRVGAGLGKAVNAPTHESLLADYYPPTSRMGVFSAHRMANSVGQFVGPALAGGLAYLIGWRAPFIVLAVPTFVFVLLSLRMKEPIRGEHERREQTDDEELIAVEERPPSWDESWRLVLSVRTMRRIWWSFPFLVGGIFAVVSVRSLFWEEVFGLNEVQRGVVESLAEPFQIAGYLLAIPLLTRMLADSPQRVLRWCAIAAVGIGVCYAAFSVAPAVPVAAVAVFLSQVILAAVVPALTAIASLVLPPRARSFGLSLGRVMALPGLSIVLMTVGQVGDAHGMRWGTAVVVPVFLLGALILATASVEIGSDMRAVQMASLAAAEFRTARDKGQAKLLVCRGVDVHYGQVQVLFDVDFDVDDGELVALLGTNGAGKSTLLRAITGAVNPSGGAVVFDGQDVTRLSPQESLQQGIVYMPGGKAVFPTLTVAENLAAGGWTRRDDPEGLAADIEEVYRTFPVLRERQRQRAGDMSGGEQQMLGLGMAFIARPRLLAIDELSLGLAPKIVETLLDVVRRIHAGGTTVVVVEQSVNVALTLADRAVFLEKGEVRFEGATSELLERDDILRSVFLEGAAAALGQGNRTEHAAPRDARPAAAGDELVLRVRDVAISYGGIRAVDGVSLHVAPGEILGLIGPNGAGKTTLFDLISGYVPTMSGAVELRGEDVTTWRPDQRARAGLGRSFQDARLFPSMTVEEVIAVGFERHLLGRDPILTLLATPEIRLEQGLLQQRVDELIELGGLGRYRNTAVGELSTGTRRIVDIVTALAHRPDVLLLDEPSSGIAQRETEALGPLIEQVREVTGTAIVLIEHDMPLITTVSDRLVALEAGRVLAVGQPQEVIRHPRVVASYLGSDEAAISRSGTADETLAT